jgi:2-keto-3-deoxy-L-rhamnonate aldolase RhmA
MTPISRTNKLRESMRNGKPTLGTHIHSSWPGMVEAIGNSGMMDYVEFTSVYAPFDLYALDNLARTAELYSMPMMIKVDPVPNYFLAQRAIGSGIQNILFADLRTVAQVEDAVKSVRAEGAGGLNGCSMHRLEGYSLECGTAKFVQYAKDAVVAIMMEKLPLYEKLEDVLNLEGVDMIQFGPCDFAMSIGVHGQYSHPKVREAEERTIKLSLKYDKHPRVEIDSYATTGQEGFQKTLKRYTDLGVKDYCIGADVVIMLEWMREYGGLTRKALKMDA